MMSVSGTIYPLWSVTTFKFNEIVVHKKKKKYTPLILVEVEDFGLDWQSNKIHIMFIIIPINYDYN